MGQKGWGELARGSQMSSGVSPLKKGPASDAVFYGVTKL